MNDTTRTVRLSVDCMGGDHGPSVTLPACRSFLDRHPDAELVLVGTEQALAPAAGWARCHMVIATEVVEMDDPVEVALRKKRDSSMRVAIQQVKPDGNGVTMADACVSAGNTGALMAVARYLLKTLDGIDRPAIASVMPNQHDGFTTMLDLGANVDFSAEHLLQFAVMGSALVSAVDGKEAPTVGLLNIGEEAIKGNETIKRAGELLRAVSAAGHINFHGNVEGNDIFKGTTDLVVCDGFVGNVVLKFGEGLAKAIMTLIKEAIMNGGILAKLGGLLIKPALKGLKKRLDPAEYGGALLLGIRAPFIICHGSSKAKAITNAIHVAMDFAEQDVVSIIKDKIAESKEMRN